MLAVIERDGNYYAGEYRDKFDLPQDEWTHSLQDAKVYDIKVFIAPSTFDPVLVSEPELPKLQDLYWRGCQLRAIKKELICV
jgi:hypothetical protein